jgi:hypothetical protein
MGNIDTERAAARAQILHKRKLVREAKRLCERLGKAIDQARREGWRSDAERLTYAGNRATMRLWRREDTVAGREE